MALLDEAKAKCRVTTTAFNDEIESLINAGLADMGMTNIGRANLNKNRLPAPVKMALLTYVAMNFKLNNGQVDGAIYNLMKASYDEQKSQLLMSSEWGDYDE